MLHVASDAVMYGPYRGTAAAVQFRWVLSGDEHDHMFVANTVISLNVSAYFASHKVVSILLYIAAQHGCFCLMAFPRSVNCFLEVVSYCRRAGGAASALCRLILRASCFHPAGTLGRCAGGWCDLCYRLAH